MVVAASTVVVDSSTEIGETSGTLGCSVVVVVVVVVASSASSSLGVGVVVVAGTPTVVVVVVMGSVTGVSTVVVVMGVATVVVVVSATGKSSTSMHLPASHFPPEQMAEEKKMFSSLSLHPEILKASIAGNCCNN